jgi:hypothetical protein
LEAVFVKVMEEGGECGVDLLGGGGVEVTAVGVAGVCGVSVGK